MTGYRTPAAIMLPLLYVSTFDALDQMRPVDRGKDMDPSDE